MLRFTTEMLVAALLAASAIAPAYAAEEEAGWFVLRHETTGDCWTGLLIRVDGEYAHAFAEVAGGPYDDKQEALAVEAKLQKDGTCTTYS